MDDSTAAVAPAASPPPAPPVPSPSPPPLPPQPCAVECRYYQSRVASAAKRLELTSRGIELLPSLTSSSTGATAASATTTRDKSADVIPWSDVLGASVLSLDALMHVPGYKIKGAAVDPRTDFVVFGCIPKSNAIKKSILTSGLQVLTCFGGEPVGETAQEPHNNDKKRKRSTAPACGPCDRVLVQWVFRYGAEDANTFMPQIVQAICERADPRFIQPTIKPDAESLNRRVSVLVLSFIAVFNERLIS